MRTLVKLNGEEWSFDEAELDLKDAFALKAASGLTVPAMLRGVAEYDPAGLQALVWFCKYKAGDVVNIATINFRMVDLDLDQVEEPDDESSDPTTGSASTP